MELPKYIAQVSNTNSICTHTFYLTLFLKNYNNIEKLFLLVDENKVTIQQFNRFIYSNIFNTFTVLETIQFFDRLCSYGIEGKKICISIILSKIDKNNSEIKNYLLKIICSENIFLLIDHDTEMQGALFQDFLAGFIRNDKSDEISEIVQNISEQIIDYYLTIGTNRFNIRGDIIFILDILFSKSYFKQLLNDILAPYFLRNPSLFEIKFSNIHGSCFNPGRIFFSTQKRMDITFDWCRKTPQSRPMIAKIMPLKKGETWHHFAKKIIDEFGNDSNVLNKILKNLSGFSYHGSAEPYFQQQKNLFEQLKDHPLESVRNWAQQQQNYCSNRMERERIEYENYYL
jgi:hypothetical protein